MTENEEEFPIEGSTFNGTEFKYSVQVKAMTPFSYGDQIILKDWGTIKFDKMPEGCGVPNKESLLSGIWKNELLTWPAANAMKWWLIAIMNEGMNKFISVRILKHKLETKNIETIVESLDEIGPFESGRPDAKKDV